MLIEFIKETRQKKAWKQADMAKQMGVSTQAISNIERGVMKPPVQFLVKFCDVFHVPQETLKELFVEYQQQEIKKEAAEKWNKAVSNKMRFGLSPQGFIQ